MIKREQLSKSEPVLFWFFLLIHLLPVFFLTPFVTLDGAAHLYNARLIHTLISEPHSVANSFFQFNSFPEPNWTFHAIASVMLFFLPAWITEKLILLSILIFTAMGFRLLTLELNPKSGWMSWMYFPLLYSSIFTLGFFNFLIGFAMLSYVIVFWIQNKSRKFSLVKFLLLIIASAILYFSHLVVFMLAGLFMFLISISDFRLTEKEIFLNQLKSLFIIFLPGACLCICSVFFKTAPSNGIIYKHPLELINSILNAEMLISFVRESEIMATRNFFIFLLLSTFWAIRNRSIHIRQKSMLRIMICSFLLIFILPDSIGSGGILSIRLVLLFYFAWMCWLTSLNIPTNGRITIAIIALCFSLFFMIRTFETRKYLCQYAENFSKAADRMENGAVVLPLNYDMNWLKVHLCDYIGTEKNIIVLKNYEATSNVFPVTWKTDINPELHLGDFPASRKPCINISNFEKISGIKINYISIQNMPDSATDSCTKSVFHQLDSLFIPLTDWYSTDLKIFKRK